MNELVEVEYNGELIEIEVPEGTTDQQIFQFLSENAGTPAPSQPQTNSQPARGARQEHSGGMTPLDAGLVSVGKGMTDMGRAASMGASKVGEMVGLVDAEQGLKSRADTRERARAEDATFQPLRDEFPIASTVGEGVGQAAAVPVAGPAGGVGRVVVGTILGGLVGGSAEAGQGGSNSDIATGTGFGLVGGTVGEMVGPIVAKFGTKGLNAVKAAFQRVTGRSGANKYVDDTGLTQEGAALMEELGVTEDQLIEQLSKLDVPGDVKQAASQIRRWRAGKLGVKLSRGQAEADADIRAEEKLLARQPEVEGYVADEFFDNQPAQLRSAVDQTVERAGVNPDLTNEDVGGAIKGASRELESIEKQSVNRGYLRIEEIPGGTDPIAGVPLEGEETVGKFLKSSQDALFKRQAPSKSFIAEVDDVMKDFGMTKGKPGRTSMGPLSFKNAGEMRKRLSRINAADANEAAVLASIVDDFDYASFQAAKSAGYGDEFLEAQQAARAKAEDRFKRFTAKDVIQKLNGVKKGTETEMLPESAVVRTILNSSDRVENVKRVKSLFTGSTANERSRTAYKGLQGRAVLDILDAAINPNTRQIDGKKMLAARKRFGDDMLNELLDADQLKALDDLQVVVGDATIDVVKPPKSGGRNRLADAIGAVFAAATAKRYGFIVRQAAQTVARTAQELADNKAFRQKILDGILTGASPEERVDALMSLLARSTTARTTAQAADRATTQSEE